MGDYHCSADAVTIRPESPDQGPIRCMLALSDAYHAELYPAEENHLIDPETLAAPGTTFLVARCDGVVAGFGALVEAEDADGARYGELKRMFVAPSLRGIGLGRRLLTALEEAARKKHLALLRLETGDKQPEALGLYRAVGFTERGPFGDYGPSEVSLFFEKRLSDRGS